MFGCISAGPYRSEAVPPSLLSSSTHNSLDQNPELLDVSALFFDRDSLHVCPDQLGMIFRVAIAKSLVDFANGLEHVFVRCDRRGVGINGVVWFPRI